MKQRFLQLFELKGIKNANEFAVLMNYSSPEKINRILRDDKNMPSAEILTDIANKFADININWLLTGRGSIIQNTKYSDIQEDQDIQMVKESEVPYITKRKGIPLIPISAFAGIADGSINVMELDCDRYIIPIFHGADFLISVKGSSMVPKYSSGDIVACKWLPLDTFFQWNKVYVLDTIQGALIKRIAQGTNDTTLKIVSENEKYPPYELNRNEIRKLAIVIGVIRLE